MAACDEALIRFHEDRFRPLERIAAPDMCESVARVRFAAEYVDQGCHRFHQQAARTAMSGLLAPFSGRITVLQHPQALSHPLTGFSLEEFRCNDGPFDIHVSAAYYRSAIEALLHRLPAWQPSAAARSDR